MSIRRKYGVLQLSYETTRYFNPAGQVVIQCILFDCAYVQGSPVVRREQHEYDVRKKHQEPQSCLPTYLPLLRGIFRTLPDI